jgi:hypothetical protein
LKVLIDAPLVALHMYYYGTWCEARSWTFSNAPMGVGMIKCMQPRRVSYVSSVFTKKKLCLICPFAANLFSMGRIACMCRSPPVLSFCRLANHPIEYCISVRPMFPPSFPFLLPYPPSDDSFVELHLFSFSQISTLLWLKKMK